MARFNSKLATVATSLDDSTRRLTKSDILFVAPDHHGFNLEGRPFSPFVEPLRSGFRERGFSSVVLAHFPAVLTGNRAHGNPFSMNRSMVKYRAAQALLGVSDDSRLNPYRIGIEKVEPRLLLSIGSPVDLCVAAHSAGVPHLELMHAMGTTSPPRGWDLRDPRELPNGAVCYDDVSARALISIPSLRENIVRIPHPYLRWFLKQRDRCLGDREGDFGRSSTPTTPTVLYTSQWGYAGDSELPPLLSENGVFHPEVEIAIRETLDSVMWLIRLHPVQLERRYRGVRRFMRGLQKKYGNVSWWGPSHQPLPEVAMRATTHMTMSSTSSYEVSALGLRTLTLSPQLNEGGTYSNLFEDLVAEGYLSKGTPEATLISSWAVGERRVTPRECGLRDEQLWRDGLQRLVALAGL